MSMQTSLSLRDDNQLIDLCTSTSGKEEPSAIGEENRIDPERRRYILHLLRKHLPRVIKERADKIEKNATYARLCILDAFQGRLKNGLATNSKKSKLIYNIFAIQTSDLLLNTVVISCALHTLSVFAEPDKGCSPSNLMFFFHLLVSLIHITDVALKMWYEGFHMYWSHDWQRLYVITISLNFLDLCLNGCTYYTNPLRPVVGLLRARSGRRFFTIVQKMIPGLTDTLTPMFVFLVMLMVISGLFFDDRLEKFKDAEFTSYNWFWMIYTNDTYDNLLPYELVRDWQYVFFFFISIYLGQKFLLSLILGATFDTFRDFTAKQLRDERNKQLQGLVKAFAALDDHKMGVISEAVFCAVLAKYQPTVTSEEKALYFELISSGSTGGVNVLQFINLRDVLNYNFIRLRDNIAMQLQEGFYDQIAVHASKIIIPIPKHLIESCKDILKIFDQYNLRYWANYLDVFLISVGLFDYAPLPMMGITPCIFMTTFYLFELQITLISEEGKLWNILQNRERFSYDFLFGVFGTLLGHFFSSIISNLIGIQASGLFGILMSTKFRLATRFFRCMRICRMDKDLSTFINAMIDVMPLFCQSMTFALIVTYIFAMMGNLMFGDYIDKWNSPLKAMVVMNTLFLPANFVSVMEEAMEEVHELSALYFTAYFILSLLVGNLSLSVIIEWYSENVNDKSNDARESRAEANNQLFQTIIKRAMGRRILRGGTNKDKVHFNDIRYTKRTSTDHRAKLVGASTVDLDDLKKCQKYSNIDLAKFYNETYRHHKDVNAETEFILKAKECGACTTKKFDAGAILFNQGSLATDIILITLGDVKVKHPNDSDLDVQLHAVNAIGYESLQPKGIYGMTCVAESSVECLMFSQDDLTMGLDPELAGSLIRLVYKSEAIYEERIKEKQKILLTRRKSNRRLSYAPSMKVIPSFSSIPRSLMDEEEPK
eukprot:gene1488-2867_t